MIGELKYLKDGKEEKTQIDLDKLGIFIVEMQDEFHKLDQLETSKLLGRQKDLLKIASMNDYPVIVQEESPYYYGETHPEIKKIISHIPRKKYVDASHNHDLYFSLIPDFINEHNIEHIVVSGINTREGIAFWTITRLLHNTRAYEKKIIFCNDLIFPKIGDQVKLYGTPEYRPDEFGKRLFYNEKYKDIIPFLEQKTIIS